jgi:UDP-2,4-diacetamido-2,4,6-trideoxy-beta-L-altropyranose hydrolase
MTSSPGTTSSRAGVVVVADAAPAAGRGHVSRCTGLVSALEARGVEVTPLALGPDRPFRCDDIAWEPFDEGRVEAEVLVLDVYGPPPQAPPLRALSPLAVFHDFGAPSETADLVISVAGGDGPAGRWLTGPRFACLRRAYWSPPPRAIREAADRILVSAGSGAGDWTARLAQAARSACPHARVEAVTAEGASLPEGVTAVAGTDSLADHLEAADLVLCAAGQTMLEALAMGAPCLAVPVVENQRAQASALGGLDAVVFVEPDHPEQLEPAVAALAADAPRRRRLAAAAQWAIDGRGAQRVATAVEDLMTARR